MLSDFHGKMGGHIGSGPFLFRQTARVVDAPLLKTDAVDTVWRSNPFSSHSQRAVGSAKQRG